MIPVVEIRVDHCWLKVIVIRPHSFLVSYLSVSTSVEPGFLEYIQTCKALCHGSDRNWGLNWDHQVQYLHILLLFAKVIQSVYVAYLHSYRHINLVYDDIFQSVERFILTNGLLNHTIILLWSKYTDIFLFMKYTVHAHFSIHNLCGC